jgi:hypothetical protein
MDAVTAPLLRRKFGGDGNRTQDLWVSKTVIYCKEKYGKYVSRSINAAMSIGSNAGYMCPRRQGLSLWEKPQKLVACCTNGCVMYPGNRTISFPNAVYGNEFRNRVLFNGRSIYNAWCLSFCLKCSSVIEPRKKKRSIRANSVAWILRIFSGCDKYQMIDWSVTCYGPLHSMTCFSLKARIIRVNKNLDTSDKKYRA